MSTKTGLGGGVRLEATCSGRTGVDNAKSVKRCRSVISCFAIANTISLNSVPQSSIHQSRVCPLTCCSQSSEVSANFQKMSRRAVLSLAAASALAASVASAQEAPSGIAAPYDANKTRRFVGIGRPPPDRAAPQFEAGKKLFEVDEGLEAQDVEIGHGDKSVRRGSLVVARWAMLLDDGNAVDVANEKQAAMFRPGAHQVPPGVEDSVIGMRAGGVRRVKGTSERILTNVSVGYDIGERSLIPTGANLFIDISVDRIDPYGSQ